MVEGTVNPHKMRLYVGSQAIDCEVSSELIVHKKQNSFEGEIIEIEPDSSGFIASIKGISGGVSSAKLHLDGVFYRDPKVGDIVLVDVDAMTIEKIGSFLGDKDEDDNWGTIYEAREINKAV